MREAIYLMKVQLKELKKDYKHQKKDLSRK